MSDREMLEDAAKAAGLDAQWDCPERGMMMLTPNGVDTMTWNPLTNDGDALRLAVKCRLEIGFPAPRKVWSFGRKGDVCSEEYRSDPLAATRRAIVRAAAEIGRGIAQQTARADLPEDNYYKTMAEAEETGRTAAKIGRQMP